MKRHLTFVFFILLVFESCSQKALENSEGKTLDKDEYAEYKRDFDFEFINHFPLKVIFPEYLIVNRTNKEKNDVGLILYQYGLNLGIIDTIESKVIKNGFLAKYKSTDSCLLVVNRFETFETHKNVVKPPIIDSSLVDRKCYEKKYPIPNFIDYSLPNTKIGLKLDDSFDLFVFEAKPKPNNRFELQPSPQMPSNWKNGYSKGVAISKRNKTVIYWAIIW